MFRFICNKVASSFNSRSVNLLAIKNTQVIIPKASVSKMPMEHDESAEEFMDRMECYFNRPEIDGWELRKGMNDCMSGDFVPEPRVILAALCACRRCNDYACTTRFLEAVKYKCGSHVKTLYPYILKELDPALKELGINTPEEMGYGEPELYLKDIFTSNE